MATPSVQAPPKGPKVDVAELLTNDLFKHDENGNVVQTSLADLEGKYLGIYCSAHWCPPCRQFTPVLRSVYETLKAQGKPFEVVFVSSDNSKAEYERYFDEMPWIAVPYGAETRRHGIGRRFNVMGIPTLIILDPEGHTINHNARAAVVKDREGQNFPWAGEEEPRSFNWTQLLMLLLLIWMVVRMFTDKQ